MKKYVLILASLLGCLWMSLLLPGDALAQEAMIRKKIAERYPDFPRIDEVTKIAVPGWYELRMGTDVMYIDESGDYLFRGNILDSRRRTNLTEDRIAKLIAIDFKALPLKDALVSSRGNGERKIAVFVDPNCGYCKQFERELQGVDNITVYVFLYPVLGPDSELKSRRIWCSKDGGKAWTEWMLSGKLPEAESLDGKCDRLALRRNMEFGERHKIDGTPGVVFEDGTRSAGALTRIQVEKRLAGVKVPTSN